jgi:hypothetical protein
VKAHGSELEYAMRGRPDLARWGAETLAGAEVVALRVSLLTDDRDVVPGEAPFARERTRVHVRAGSAEEVAVPEQNAHGSDANGYVRWKYNA